MIGFTATLVLRADTGMEAGSQGGSNAKSVIGSVSFHEGFAKPLSIITTDPTDMDRLADAATKAAQLMRDRATATETPAPAASTPVPQATDAGVAEPAAAPASLRAHIRAQCDDTCTADCGHCKGRAVAS